MPEAEKKVGGNKPSHPARKVGQGLWTDDTPKLMKRPEDGIDATKDLNEEEREMFARLLKQEMSLEERARQLVNLAKMKGSKTAAVGLRAIQEINAITGVHDPKPTEAPAMFKFPDDTNVSIHIEKVVK